MVLRKSFYIRWSAGRSPRVHEVNPGRDPSVIVIFWNFWMKFLLRRGECKTREIPIYGKRAKS